MMIKKKPGFTLPIEKSLKKKKDCNCGKNKKKINVKGGRLV
jgi:hypothetical protein